MNKRRKQSIWLRRNLPLLIAAAALVLLVLIIVLVARGCSKGSDTVIRAKAFSTGTTIELPLSAELNESDFVSYGGYQFTTKKKLSALSKLITKNNEGITAETYTNSYGECGVYTKTNESGGTDSWCLYVKDPKNTNEKWYFFMGEHREIALDSGTLDLLLPLHLITDASLRDTMFAAVQPGTPYTCGIDKLPDGQTLSGMFRAFYEASGLYTVTTSDKGFTLVPRGGAQELMFQFDEQDANGQFMITVPQAAEPQPSTSAVVTYGSDDPVSLSESDAAALSPCCCRPTIKRPARRRITGTASIWAARSTRSRSTGRTTPGTALCAITDRLPCSSPRAAAPSRPSSPPTISAARRSETQPSGLPTCRSLPSRRRPKAWPRRTM